LKTFDAVPCDTPAASATSLSLIALPIARAPLPLGGICAPTA
jgi:hypothetical protein